ncbi:O-acetyl-ADP-ribose deacetylase [Azospirillum sp. TSO22-1]|uniref:O-acetyl-ADP-ribose deacetylase n=1 Tax=Azospirillum sp. TSO22-1 TaxID=716789 RepID=UPI001FFEC782|nr:O-acetyl-ADP-ribose deacetylase [Azospirillum sp. TSO22-1]
MSVVEGDLTRVAVDAVVNAANSALKRGGGVDGAIHAAAGPGLQAELDQIGGCPTGECRITRGHRLPAPWIIHAVGPVWRGGAANEDSLLESCYRTAFALARRHGLASLAFPAISTGIYGFPKDRAVRIAVAAALDELSRDDAVADVRFVCFDAETAALYRAELAGR